MVEAGLVTRGQLEAALARQRSDRRRLGTLLVEAGFLTSAQLSQTLSHQLSLPWVSLARVPIDPELLELLPASLAMLHHVVPVHLKLDHDRGDVLFVATDDPTQEEALASCAEHAGMPVRAVVAAPDDLQAALARYYGAPGDPTLGMSAGAAPPAALEPMGDAMAAVARKLPPLPARTANANAPELDDDDLLVELATDPPPPTTEPAPRRPVVLVVSPPRELLRECRLAASPLGVLIAATDLASLRTAIEEHSPLAVVVTDELYAFDRVAFARLSLESGSPLVIWSDELDAEYLEPVFATALRRASASG